MPTPKKILIVRNDKLGDFMLAWPSIALLRRALPNVAIHALVPPYTQPIAELCPALDATVADPGRGTGWAGLWQITSTLCDQRYDAVITLFSTGRIGAAVRAARIPYRLAPATKLAQLCYNHREIQRRSRSEKPEWLYNVDLIRRFLRDWNTACPPLPPPPYLEFDERESESLRERFHRDYSIPTGNQLVFIHPGSGGSANNLQADQFAALAAALRSATPLTFVVSAGPGEHQLATQVAALIEKHGLSVRTYFSDEGLVAFARHLALAHVFISGSTGPLHIAGALNVRTVGFYPSKRSSTPLRWQTLSEPSKRLAFAPSESADESRMLDIDIDAAAALISDRFLSSGHRDAALSTPSST